MSARPPLRLFALLLVSVAGSCASGAHLTSTSGSVYQAGVPAARSSHVITAAEMQQFGSSTALEAMARLRPEFVRSAPGGTVPGSDLPVLYLNGARHGRIDLLASLPARLIDEMRYFRPGEARDRFGIRDGSAVVAVKTQRLD